MRKNLSVTGELGADGRRYLPDDWCAWGIPANVVLADSVYIDTSYGFAEFHSQQQPGLVIGRASGCYDNPCFLTGPAGRITVGDFSVLNATKLICNERIDIGSHCMLAWGSIVTDTWLAPGALPPAQRRMLLEQVAHTPSRYLVPGASPTPVVLEDNCWVGFGAVILPGVRVGRGAIVASKTIVSQDVPAYAVVAGSPARVVRQLAPDDTEEARALAFREYLAEGS
jgi:acetyltransferase-like isoleucine patch superfamily enzyme